jgi:hypothetical protein
VSSPATKTAATAPAATVSGTSRELGGLRSIPCSGRPRDRIRTRRRPVRVPDDRAIPANPHSKAQRPTTANEIDR